MPTRYPLDERSGRSASTRLGRPVCEALEQRRHLDFGVGGDPGHAYIAVDIWHPTTGELAGRLKAEFHAPGFCGDPAPQTGVIYVQGRLHYVYWPDRRAGDFPLARKVEGNKDIDQRVGEFIHGVGGPSPAALALLDQPIDHYVDGQNQCAVYDVTTNNCFTFASEAIDSAFVETWDTIPRTTRPVIWHELMEHFDKLKAAWEKLTKPRLGFWRTWPVELRLDILQQTYSAEDARSCQPN